MADEIRTETTATTTVEREPGRERTRERLRRRTETWRDSTTGLLRGLATDVTTLARKEVELVRTEMAEKLDQLTTGVSEIGSGVLVTYAGFLVLLYAAVLGLNEWIEQPWLSALIVGGVVLVVGLILLGVGRSNVKARNLKPERSARSLRRDAELVRDEAGRAR